MAMIQCPECGQEVSCKAKKCINCGKVLIEEVVPSKFCSECGKEIPADTNECPFCGCPVETEVVPTNIIARITGVAVKNKKPLLIVAALCAIIVLFATLNGSILNKDEQLAYKNAKEMQSMMRDPDSFRLYDEMFLLKHHDENGKNDFTYTIFKYGGANGYGAITTDEAIFKDTEYLMDYADEPDEGDANYIEQLEAQFNISTYLILGDDETLRKVEIDVEKIKDKMKLN